MKKLRAAKKRKMQAIVRLFVEDLDHDERSFLIDLLTHLHTNGTGRVVRTH